MKQHFAVTDKAVLRAVVGRLTDMGKGFEVTQGWGRGGTSTVFADDKDEAFFTELVEECRDGTVHFDVDRPEARRRVTLQPANYGPNLLVDGELFGYVDLYERSLDKDKQDTLSPKF
ncbi:MAG: hypothetical protein K8U57_11840 [Planctomycetes bacterium]|nr:hypothetical protein [Planctomycetota bacterium]